MFDCIDPSGTSSRHQTKAAAEKVARAAVKAKGRTSGIYVVNVETGKRWRPDIQGAVVRFKAAN